MLSNASNDGVACGYGLVCPCLPIDISLFSHSMIQFFLNHQENKVIPFIFMKIFYVSVAKQEYPASVLFSGISKLERVLGQVIKH